VAEEEIKVFVKGNTAREKDDEDKVMETVVNRFENYRKIYGVSSDKFVGSVVLRTSLIVMTVRGVGQKSDSSEGPATQAPPAPPPPEDPAQNSPSEPSDTGNPSQVCIVKWHCLHSTLAKYWMHACTGMLLNLLLL
jgi:hypothetical protein